MQTQKHLAWALFMVLGLAACGQSDSHDDTTDTDPVNERDPSSTPTKPDPSKPTSPVPGLPPPTAAIPLALWVEDLVDNHTTNDAQPDTVADKNIENTEDPEAFDQYLKQ